MSDEGHYLSEVQIRTQLQRGMDLSVPLESRSPMTPAAKGTVICRDSQHVTPQARAKISEDREHASGGRAIIDHSAPILVQRGEGADFEYLGAVGGENHREQIESTEPVTFADRPDASDGDYGIRPDSEQSPQLQRGRLVGGAEHGIGIATAPESADPETAKPAPQFSKSASAPPSAPVSGAPAPPTLPKAPQPVESTVTQAPTIQKQTVILRSPGMGKVRVKVAHVAVSDSIIVLGYIDDEESLIAEPPVCDDLEVTVGGETYSCAYREFTCEWKVPGTPDMLLVVLIRVSE